MATYTSHIKVTYSHCFHIMWSDSLYVILYLMYKLLYKYFLHLKYKGHLYPSFCVKYQYLV